MIPYSLRHPLESLLCFQTRATKHRKTQAKEEDTMADNKVQDFTDDRNEGHIDTREANFECENKDPNLGCDMGIDVAG